MTSSIDIAASAAAAVPRVRRAALETLTTFFRLYSRQKKERNICTQSC
jgi:hypothetical protein